MGSSCQKAYKIQSNLENDLMIPINYDNDQDLNIKTDKYCLLPKFLEPQTFTYYSKSDISDFESDDNGVYLTRSINLCSIQSELENYLEQAQSSDPPSVPLKISQHISFEIKKEDQNFISLQSNSPGQSGQFQRIRNISIQQEKYI